MVGNDVCGLSSRYNYVYYYISVERPGREVRLFYDKNKEVGAGRYQPRKTQAISCILIAMSYYREQIYNIKG